MRGFYGDQEDYSMDNLPPNARILIEYILRVSGILMTKYNADYFSPVVDLEDDYPSQLGDVDDGSLPSETTLLRNNHEARVVYQDDGKVSIEDVPVTDPNNYDLHLNNEVWESEINDVLEKAWYELNENLHSEVIEAIRKASKDRRKRARAYNLPPAQLTSGHLFEYAYIPVPFKCNHQVLHQFPPDNTYIDEHIYDNRSIHVSRIIMNTCKMNGNQKSSCGDMLIDGGCDTSLVGNGFIIESTTNRTVSVQGFQDQMKIEELPIVTAITAIDLDEETYILEVNETIYVKYNGTSLLSTYQARDHGVVVNDISLKHGEKQNIIIDDVSIGLAVKGGLLSFPIREPTKDEITGCTRLVMTSDYQWNAPEINASMPSSNNMHITETFIFDPKDLQGSFKVHAYMARSTITEDDLLSLQAKMAWMPIPVLERTLQVTTRLAKNYFRLPLRSHFKSQFPALNRNRLQEVYSTDTFFASVPGLNSKATCMQLFVGNDSMFTAGYEMTTESEGSTMLEQFIADVGAPYRVHSDNANMETSAVWKGILRKYNIAQSTTEPHYPQQNRSERRIQEIKKGTNRILDHTGAPTSLWVYATKYFIDVLNHTSSKSLYGDKTAIEAAFGITPDISALIKYSFYEPIYVFQSETSFPDSKEIPGRFLGLAKNIGDALTYYVLTENKTVLARSVVRSALDILNVNCRALPNYGNLPPEHTEDNENLDENSGGGNEVIRIPVPDEQDIFKSQNIYNSWDNEAIDLNNGWTEVGNSVHPNTIIQSTKDILEGNVPTPTVDPSEIIGVKFLDEYDGVKQCATVKDWTSEGKFIIEFVNGGEELRDYNGLINHYNQPDEENAEMYSFDRILNHKKEGNKYFLEIQWSNGEVTWEPMTVIKTSDPLTVARYAHDNKLVNLKGWKWAKRHHRNPNKFIRMLRIFKAKIKKTFKKYKFGVQVPRNIQEALAIDKEDGNNLWSEAINKEISELMKMNTFIYKDDFSDIPNDYQYVPSTFLRL